MFLAYVHRAFRTRWSSPRRRASTTEVNVNAFDRVVGVLTSTGGSVSGEAPRLRPQPPAPRLSTATKQTPTGAEAASGPPDSGWPMSSNAAVWSAPPDSPSVPESESGGPDLTEPYAPDFNAKLWLPPAAIAVTPLSPTGTLPSP